jgi:hypothetical protein
MSASAGSMPQEVAEVHHPNHQRNSCAYAQGLEYQTLMCRPEVHPLKVLPTEAG